MVFPFRSSKPSRSPKRGGAPDVAPAPPAPVLAPAPLNRRLISGQRVLCRCSLDLPNHDPFSSYRARRAGYIIMNVRGGSLYLPHQLTEEAALKAFPKGKASQVKRFTLYPKSGEPIVVGDIHARYLKLTTGQRLSGLVLRFVGLDEAQLDLLNGLPTRCPAVDGGEEAAIPVAELHRLEGLAPGL